MALEDNGSSLEIDILPEPIKPIITDIPRSIDNNDSQKYSSLVIAIIPTIIFVLFWIILFYYYIRYKRYNKGGYLRLITIINIYSNDFYILSYIVLFVMISAWSSYYFESNVDLDDQNSKNILYKHRTNEKFAYSFIALICLLLFSLTYLKTSKESVIAYFGGIVITITGITVLSYFSYKFLGEVLEDSSQTGSEYGIALLSFLYVLYFSVMTTSVNNKNKGFPFFMVLLFTGLFIGFITVAIQNSEIIQSEFTLDSVGNTVPTSYYSCKGIYRSEQDVVWYKDTIDGGDIKINFDINLNYLNSDKILIKCGTEDDISWTINWVNNSKSLQLLYKNVSPMILPIYDNMLETAPKTSEEPTPISSVNVTMIVRSYKDLNNYTGSIVFYHDSSDNQKVNSIFLEQMLPPNMWNTRVSIPYYDTVKNFVYCNRNTSSLTNMNSTVKFVFILLLTVIVLLFVLSTIHPKVRIGIFGSEIIPFNFPGTYYRIMQ